MRNLAVPVDEGGIAMRNWHDVGITLPYSAAGKVCTTYLQCSPPQRKSRRGVFLRWLPKLR